MSSHILLAKQSHWQSTVKVAGTYMPPPGKHDKGGKEIIVNK